MCDTLYKLLLNYKNKQEQNRNVYKSEYKHYYLENIKNKYGKLIEYKIIECQRKDNEVEMVFIKENGKYSGTDIIRYPFKIIHHELKINCRFYDLRGSFATKTLRNGIEIKDIAKTLGHSRIETTQNYYVNCTKDNLKKVSETFDKEMKLKEIEKINNYYLEE